MTIDPETSLREQGLDLEAWEPAEPSSRFTDDVLTRVAPKRRSTRLWMGSAVFAAAAGAFGVWFFQGTPHGEAIARERTEVRIGRHAAAVLEPEAHVRFHGDDVEQDRGDVFYRVDRGTTFRVHTPHGDVSVLGTCFRVRVGQGEKDKEMQKRDVRAAAVGAALSAVALVTVYEGRVIASHGKESVELKPGESAALTPSGVQREGDGPSAKSDGASPDDPLEIANKNLVDQVREYKARLVSIEEQKKKLEDKLTSAEHALSQGADGGGVARHPFDLTPDDWKTLGAEGQVKYRVPCTRAADWSPAPEWLTKLGLSPDDAPAVKAAFTHSNERLWKVIRPLCVAALGSDQAVDQIGMNTCTHLVLDLEQRKDKDRVAEAFLHVAEVNAGTRPAPSANQPVHPVERMFLTKTTEMARFEAELAQSLGPEEARRIAFSEDLCVQSSTFGNGRPSKK